MLKNSIDYNEDGSHNLTNWLYQISTQTSVSLLLT